MSKAREHFTKTDAKFGKGEEFCVELLRFDPKFDMERYQGRLKVMWLRVRMAACMIMLTRKTNQHHVNADRCTGATAALV